MRSTIPSFRRPSSFYLLYLDVHIVVQGVEEPSDMEWDALTSAVRHAVDPNAARVLMITEGGMPNTLQRKRLLEASRDTHPRFALLSDNAAAHTTGAAIRWFNERFAAFAFNELTPALDHLTVPTPPRNALVHKINEMRRSLSLSPLPFQV